MCVTGFSHGWACGLELLNQLAHEVWKLVDRHWRLHQSTGASFFDSREPTGHSGIADVKSLRSLRVVPAAHCFESQNREAHCRWVVRTTCCRDAVESGVFDAQFFFSIATSAFSCSFSPMRRTRSMRLLTHQD